MVLGWLFGNAVFSETALRIFLIFYIKFGDYKGRKVTELFDLEIFAKKVSKLDQNQKLSYFSQRRLNDFFGFWPEVRTKYDLQFEWNLFFRKSWNFEILGLEIVKKIAKIKVLGHFLDFALLVFLYFVRNNRWEWCLVVFLQFAGPVNALLSISKN